MKLPTRFDYIETSGKDQDGVMSWWPLVVCREKDCAWGYDAAWSELAVDGDTDWDKLHPAHSRRFVSS